jgi:hydroxymethylpyrimidine/phosphomethylpyrimidine kinase
LTPLELLEQQANSLLEDMSFEAVKIGMTGSVQVVELIARLLPRLGDIPVVLDPVLAAESGGSLAQGDLPTALARLFPQVSLITPNLPEAQQLSGETALMEVGRVLLGKGVPAVLITGTHDDTPQVQNHLFTAAGVDTKSWKRLPGSFHGSGCTLASAIACLLAQGKTLEEAVAGGQDFTHASLQKAFHAGRGQWIPNR